MRKFLLSAIALMMSVAMMAIGLGDGTSKANAIDFDWANGNVHEASEALWYDVDMTPVTDAKYLVLYLTNLADEAATVHIDMSVQGFDATMSGVDTVIAAGKYYRFEFPKEMINTLLETYGLSAYASKIENLSLSLQSDQKVMLAANVYTTEAEFIQQEVLTHLEEIDWNEGVKQEALSTKWYEVDITSVKQNQQHMRVSFKNYADETAVLAVSFILDNEIHTMPLPVPASFDKAVTLDYQILRLVPSKTVKVGVTTTATIEVATSVKSALAEDQTPCLNAINPQHGVEYAHAAGATQWYALSLDWLESQADYSSLYLANKGSKTAHVTIGMVPNCKYTTGTTVTLPIPAGFDLGVVAPNIVGRLLNELTRFEGLYGKVDSKEVYLEIHSDQPLAFGLDVKNATTNPCEREDLIAFDWNKGATLTPNVTQWYDVDITKVKESGKHLKLSFTNPTNTIVWVASVVSLDCPAKLTMPMIVPVYPGMSVDKVIDYSFVAAQPIDHIYVGVVAEEALIVGASLIDATVEAPVDCINHVEVKSGERYVHKAGTTWYKFSNDLLANMSSAPRFTFENLSSNAISFTAGVTVDCEYGILTHAKGKIPADVLGKDLHNREFSVRIPREFFQAVRKLIDSDVTEFMLQLTANNPFAFSIDMQSEDACAEAKAFDWEGCFDLQANQNAWYKVDVNTPLNSEEAMTVALYNNSDYPVTITAEVSPTCPVMFSMIEKFELGSLDSAIVTVKPEKVAELIKEYDKYLSNLSCYARFHATGNVTVCVNDERIVTPDEPTPDEPCCPEECEDVPALDWKKVVKLSDITLNQLYKLDITGAYAAKNINFFVNNDLKKDTIVIASEIYKSCQDAAPVAQHSNKVPAGFSMAQVAHDKFAALVDSAQCCMFVKFTAFDTIPVTPDTPVVPPTPECEDILTDTLICAGKTYEWPVNGKVYTEKTQVTVPAVTTEGCKFNYILKLDVINGDTLMPVEYAEICEGDVFPWRGLECTEDTTYTVEKSLSCGTATYTLVVTYKDDCTPVVPPTPECEDIVTDTLICAGKTYEWPVNGKVYTEKTQVTVPAVTTEGCKFNYILKLDVINGDTLMPVEYAEICEGDVFPWRGLECTEDTTYTVEKSLSCGTATYTLVVTYKDDCGPIVPPAGEDCEHATLLNWRNGIRLSQLSAGWYKLDVKDVHANKENVAVKVINDLTCKATVTAAAYAHCEDEDALSEGSKTFKLGESTKTVSYADFADVVPPHVDVVYVNIVSIVENCDPIIPGKDCEHATELNWRNGVRLSQLSAGWYKLDVKAVHANKESVTAKVINDLTCKATVTAAGYAHCEDEDALYDGSKTFKLGESTKTVSYADFADVVPPHVDVVYVNIVSIVENCDPIIPGKDCEDATELNWRNGIRLSQLSAGWYKLDVKAVHANKENVAVKVINDLTCKATVTAAGYAHCEDDEALYAGSKTFALGEASKTVAYADFADVVPAHVEYVYVKIASIVEDCEPIEPGKDCEDATELNWRNGVRLSQLSAGWYKLDVKAVHANKENVAVKVINDLTCKATVTAAGYAHCEDEDALYDGSKTFKLGEASKTVAYADFADVVPAHVEYIYVKIASIVEDCEPIEPGKDCEDATELNWRNGVRLSQLSAGWYKLDVKAVHANKESVTAKVINDLDCEATVVAAAYAHCEDDEALYAGSKTFALGEASKTVAYADFADVVPAHVEYVYVNIASIVENCEPDCEHAEELDWRNGVRLSQLKAGWYKLDVKDVHANQESVTALVINDLDCEATVVAAGYAHCEDEDALYDGSKTFALGEASKTVAYADFADVVPAHVEYIYVHITDISTSCEPECEDVYVEFTAKFCGTYKWNGETFTEAGDYVREFALETGCKFIVTLHLIEDCEPCADWTEIDWRAGIKLSQLTEGGKYKLNVASVHAGKADVTVAVDNDLECKATVAATAKAYCEDDEVLIDGSNPFELGVTEHVIKYAEFADVVAPHVEYLYVQVTSIVEECEVEKDTVINTVTEFICDGTEYVDVTGEKHVVSSLIDPALLTWSVTTETETTVTIYNYVITPIVAPVVMTAEVLATIPGATPVLEAGKKVDVTGTLEAIKNYYDMNDTEAIADVETVVWAAGADATLACDAESHTMILALTSGCEFKWTAELTFEVAPVDVIKTTETATICEGETYPWGDEFLSETGTYPLEVKNEAGCVVEIKTLELTVTPAEEVEETVAACDSYEWHGTTYTKSGDYTYTENCRKEILHLTINTTEVVEETVAACDSYEWHGTTYTTSGDYSYEADCRKEILHLTINTTEVVEETVAACDSYEWHGTTYTTSGDYSYEADCRKEILHLTINKSETEEFTVAACDSYEWHGTTYTTSGDYSYEADCRKEILHLTINTTEVVEETVAACESYEWYGTTYTTSGDYTFEADCRKEILHLTINTAAAEDTTVTECYAYTWNGETYTESGDYTYSTTAANGCDSIVTLHLTITAETSETNPTLGEAVAVAKYGNRMVVLHLNGFAEKYGWTPAGDQVTWYQVVGEMDNSWEIVDDKVLGNGLYVENLDGFTGEIYAIIDASNEGVCGNLYRTKVLVLAAAGQAPKLMPTIAQPSETLHLTNLNPENVTEVRVYSTSGELMATYNAEQASEFVFKAATLPGYYMVEVQNNGEQTTLRYIVK